MTYRENIMEKLDVPNTFYKPNVDKQLSANKIEIKPNNKSIKELFLLAVANNELGEAKKLLNQKEGININEIEQDGTSVLHLASIYVNWEMFYLLLQHQADIKIKDVNQSNALHYVVRYYTPISLRSENIENYEKSIDILLQKGIDINEQDDKGFTVAHHASLQKTTQMLAFLLSRGIDIYITNNLGENPIELALYEDRLDSASLMLIYDMSIKYSDYKNNIDLMEIEYLKTLNLEQYQHNSPDKSHRANKISENLTKVIDLFTRKNLKANEFCPNLPKQFEDNIFKSKLTRDQKKKFWFKQLEKCPDDKKFFFDVANARYERVETFLKKKLCDINSMRSKQKGVLHIATHNSNYKMVEILLKNKADTELKDENGDTALHLAAVAENIKIINLLISYNANIFNPNNNGLIPIHVILKLHPKIITHEIIKGYKFSTEEIINFIKYLKSLVEKFKIQQTSIELSSLDKEVFTTIKLVHFLNDIVIIKNLIRDKNNNVKIEYKGDKHTQFKIQDIRVFLDKVLKQLTLTNKKISGCLDDIDCLVNKLITIPANLYAWFNDPKQNDLSIFSDEVGKQLKKQIKKNIANITQELEQNLVPKNIHLSSIPGKFKIYLDISSKITEFFSKEVPLEFTQAFEKKFIENFAKTLFENDEINHIKCKILNSLKHFQTNEELLEKIITSENLSELYGLVYGKYGNDIDKYLEPEKQIVNSAKKIKKPKILLEEEKKSAEHEELTSFKYSEEYKNTEEKDMCNPQDYDQYYLANSYKVDCLGKE